MPLRSNALRDRRDLGVRRSSDDAAGGNARVGAEERRRLRRDGRGLPPDVALGWDLRVAAGVARWRECESIDLCGETERERPADQLIAFERVGHASAADGREIEVVKLSLAPRAKYVVPVRKLPR